MDATLRIYADGVVLSFSSIYWLTGLISIVMGTAGGSTRIITSKRFTPELQFHIIDKYRVTVINNLAYYLILMVKSGLLPKVHLSSVKTLISTGFKIPFAVLDEVNKHLPNGSVSNAYGLTELGDSIAIDYPKFSGSETAGRFVSGYTVKISDDKGNRCGVGVSGEICIKGRVKFLGYYKNEKLTEEAFDSEGFFKTGDIGYIDKDGYTYICDRKKHTILYYHHDIFPTEIEETILKLPEITDVCVIGVPYDTIFELPAAVVVRSVGSRISEAEICKFVAGWLVSYIQFCLTILKCLSFSRLDNMLDHFKLRGGVYFTDAIPTTTTGKPNRMVAKELATHLYNEQSKKEKSESCSNLH